MIKIILLLVTLFSISFSEDFVHYRLGSSYMEKGDYELALDEFRKVIAVYPDHYNAYFQIGLLRQAQDSSHLAEYNFKKALDFNPGWIKAYQQLSTGYEKRGENTKALEMLQNALISAKGDERLSIESDIDRLVERKRKILAESAPKKKVEPKKKSVSKTVKITEDAKAELDKAILAYRDGVKNGDDSKLKEALTYIRSALKMAPGYPAAYYYAGVIRRRFGQNEMARVNFENSTNDPEMGFNAHFYLGKIYSENKEYEKAVKHLTIYRDTTDYEPGKREASDMIDTYSRQLTIKKESEKVDVNQIARNDIETEISKIPEQLPLLEIEIRIEPLLTMVIVDTITDQGQAMLEGVRLFNEKKFDKSVDAFHRVLEKYPNGVVAANTIYDVGIALMKLRDWDGASRQFRQYRERFPNGKQSSNALFLTAIAQKEMRKDRTAEKLFQQYIRENRDGEWVGKSYEKMGDIYTVLDELSRAVDAYDLAEKRSGSVSDKIYALYKKGEVALKLKNWKMAEICYKAAIKEGELAKVFIRTPDSYYRLADRYYKDGKLKNAIEKYQKVTRAYKTFQDTPWGLYQIGNILKKEGKLEEAIVAYDRLMSEYPEDYWSSEASWKRKDSVWERQYGVNGSK